MILRLIFRAFGSCQLSATPKSKAIKTLAIKYRSTTEVIGNNTYYRFGCAVDWNRRSASQ